MLVPLLVLGVLLLLNGVFAMSELAVMRSRPSRLRHAAARGRGGAAAALALAEDPSRFLSTVQVGITLIGIFAGAFGQDALADDVRGVVERVPALAPYGEGIALAVVVGGITYFSLVIGELVPKRLAIAFPEAIASAIAPPLRALSVAAAPLVRVLSVSTDVVARVLGVRRRAHEDVSEEDVRAVVSSAAATGVLDPIENRIVQRVLRVADLRAASLMVPRSEVAWLDEQMSPERVRAAVAEAPYSHLPVCRGGLDQVLGVVRVRDVLTRGTPYGGRTPIRALMQQAAFVPETTNALQLLEMFQRSGLPLALVVDEYGGTEGLVTLDDIVRAIVGGERRAREGEPPRAHRREDGTWLLDGALPVFEAEGVLGIPHTADAAAPAANTVGGLLPELLGRIPSPSDAVVWRGWRLEVADMDGHRVDAVLAAPATAEPPGAGDAEAAI